MNKLNATSNSFYENQDINHLQNTESGYGLPNHTPDP